MVRKQLVSIKGRLINLEYYLYKYKVIQPRSKKYLVVDFLDENKCIALYNFVVNAFADRINTDIIGQINKVFEDVLACRSNREFIEGKYSGLDIRCNYTEVFDTYFECDPDSSNQLSMFVDTRELYYMLLNYIYEVRKFKVNPENYCIEENKIKQ